MTKPFSTKPAFTKAAPSLYEVQLLNPQGLNLDNVCEVLETCFALMPAEADDVCHTAFTKEWARVAAYPLDIAETKILDANRYARKRWSDIPELRVEKAGNPKISAG